jgi:uncharacterized protein YdeI (YjbR/CyaY-like superfamily)
MKPKFFATEDAFRDWLEANHDSDAELIVGFYKKGARRKGITRREALDAALAYGWIDGVVRSLDAERWTVRFTRRRPRSIWSIVNTKRVKELIALGRMRPPGMRAFEARDPKRNGVYLYEREAAVFDAASAKQLAETPRAKTFFDGQPAGYKQLMAKWVMSAKKEETRAKRLARLIEVSARRERIDLLNSKRSYPVD